MKREKLSKGMTLRKRPVTKAVLCSLCTVMLVSTCSLSTVSAKEIIDSSLEYSVKSSDGQEVAPIGSRAELYKSEETESAEESSNVLELSKPPIQEEVSNYAQSRAVKYTMAQLANMSYADMVNTLVTLNWSDIQDLFQYNDGAQRFYGDANRIQYLINAIRDRGYQYTSTDNKGIPTLAEVLRAGYYLSFYNSGLSHLSSRAEKEKVIPAISAIQSNANFKLGTATQDEIVSSTGLLIWNSACNGDIVQKCTPIVKDFVDNINTYVNQNSKGTAFFNIIGGIEYDISMYGYNGGDYKTSSWYGRVDAYIAQLIRVAEMGEPTNPELTWIIDNGIYMMGTMGKVHSNSRTCHEVLTRGLQKYEYLGELYFRVVDILDRFHGGIDSNGNKLDKARIVEEGKQKYLPKKYTFDDGKIVFRTGANVTQEKIQRLYWALKEVKSQFYKVAGRDNPLEIGNKDDVLSVFIYNSPKEYKMNNVLFGLSTDNGGMYIEGDGAFYTYERTPEESIYTLEELFRHELTHYLQGRYVVPGMWGTGEIYNNGRLNWFEEGGAELFAGSTRKEGVKVRKSMVSNLLSTTAANRYSAKTTLYSTYETGWDFYYYSWALQNYLYNNDKEKFNKLFDLIQKGDVVGYDAYRKALSEDAALNTAYQNHMQHLVDNYNSYNVPLVADDYLAPITDKTLQDIASEITQVSGMRNVTSKASKSDLFSSFEVRGEVVLGRSQGKLKDQQAMEKVVNGYLNTLDAKPWNGYKTTTSYYINHRVDSSNNAVFDVVFTGKLPGGSTGGGGEVVNKKPVAKIQAPLEAELNKEVQFTGSGSTDEDGQITGYSWNFGDGTSSTEVNPRHIYNRAGTFNVSLTVTDNKGETNTATTTITIKEKPVVNPSYEMEPNNSKNEANGPINMGTPFSGSISYADNSNDYFYFNVQNPADVNIKVTQKNGLQLNWIVYDAHDNMVAYATDTVNNVKSGKFNANSGKYHIVVYGIGSSVGDYDIEITSTESNNIMEMEPNNNKNEANGPVKIGKNILGSISYNDGSDDYFSFDIRNPENVEIKVTEKNGLQLNWIVYDAYDNMVAYATDTVNNVKSGKFNANYGRYYLVVYGVGYSAGDYEVEIVAPNNR